jgi:sodium transport system permease protein
MGPLFGPILFAFVINMSLKQTLGEAGEPLDVPVIGQEHAPNLMDYLKSHNINITDAPVDRAAALEAVKAGRHDLVLVVPGAFGEDLANTVPATIEVISDLANTQAERESRRTMRALRSYNQEIAALRLVARGVSPVVMRPLNIDVVDVSTPSGRSALLLGMLSYFFIFALLTGGMNLAIDATAGERERGSLETLLCLPVTRDQLIFGKIFAACLFMALSLSLSLVSFYVTLKFVPLEKLGMTPNFGPVVVAKAFLLLVPFTLLGASLMTLVASITKSFKEAQTWVSIVLLAPTLPILMASILMVRASTELMFIPSLSQHLLLVGLIKNEPTNMLHVIVSVSGTLLAGTVLAMICARLYRREGLLG